MYTRKFIYLILRKPGPPAKLQLGLLGQEYASFCWKYNPQATSYHTLWISHQTANRVLNCCSAAVFKLVQIICKSKCQVSSPFFANMHSGSEFQHCERLLPTLPLSLTQTAPTNNLTNLIESSQAQESVWNVNMIDWKKEQHRNNWRPKFWPGDPKCTWSVSLVSAESLETSFDESPY